ncbi:hypothetical protein LTR37_019933 [Vermiconidia calcicola]|uniref:Uncharacterized protein n=1 Tax=Vermiconidia calcicola TaxID=1690605 RepID=A0ACC3MEC2_9PEZI|nr:hypothetical protein LTR37_019933 [Vermiconidia calcicola]
MQELNLYSQVSSARHDQVLHILAGVTASQPTKYREQCDLYEQPKAATSVKSQTPQTQRRSYHQLVREDHPDKAGDLPSWKTRLLDVPEPGVKNVISRNVSEKTLSMDELKLVRRDFESYKLASEHSVSGHRFISGNVIIRIFRIYIKTPVEFEIPLRLLDPSGTYIVEALIRTEDGSSSALRDKAMEELLAFAETVKGAIDLRVPDRLALDPRVKGS